MSFSSLLQRLFNTISPPDDDDGMDGEISGFEMSQNFRMLLAIVVVFLSAIVTWWIIV